MGKTSASMEPGRHVILGFSRQHTFNWMAAGDKGRESGSRLRHINSLDTILPYYGLFCTVSRALDVGRLGKLPLLFSGELIMPLATGVGNVPR